MQNQFKTIEQSLSDISRSFKELDTQRQLELQTLKRSLKSFDSNQQFNQPLLPKITEASRLNLQEIQRPLKIVEQSILDIQSDIQRVFKPIEQSISNIQRSFKAIEQKRQLHTQSQVKIFHRDRCYKLPNNWLSMITDAIKSSLSIEENIKDKYQKLVSEKFARIKSRLYSHKLNLEKEIEKNEDPENSSKLSLKIKHIDYILKIIEYIEKIIVEILLDQSKINQSDLEDKIETEKLTQNKIDNSIKQIINKFLVHLSKEQRKQRIYFTPIRHINSNDGDKSKHLIIALTVLNSSKRHKITFAFLQLLTAINRLKKDDGEIRNETPEYWPSSKYRKKRRFKPNHTNNCLLQTQFCIKQTLSDFYPSDQFSVSRIC